MKNIKSPSVKIPGQTPSQLAYKSVLTAVVAALPLAAATVKADDAPPPSRVDALVSFQFSDKYLTPRGMIVHDHGLDFQPLVLGFVNVYKSDSFINSVTLVPGIWNDFTSSPMSVNQPHTSPKTDWIEIDPIAGIEIGFAKNFTLDVTYTAFNEQFSDLGTSQHLDTKLSFNDSSYLKAFALHPYLEFWQELDGKSTAADAPYIVHGGKGPGPGPSDYFEIGVAPSYTFDKIGLKLEVPCRVLLPNKDFYGTYYSGASTVGLYEVGVKATIPLKFMPPGYGHWNFNAGYRYEGFVDKNLQDMQEFNAPGHSVTGSSQIYAGISTFF
jgi:hypothetical protein